MSKEYYKILGLKETASKDDIKKAYRKLAVKYHPDKNKGSHSTKKFQKISEAYHALSDKSKRKEYDYDECIKSQSPLFEQSSQNDLEFGLDMAKQVFQTAFSSFNKTFNSSFFENFGADPFKTDKFFQSPFSNNVTSNVNPFSVFENGFTENLQKSLGNMGENDFFQQSVMTSTTVNKDGMKKTKTVKKTTRKGKNGPTTKTEIIKDDNGKKTHTILDDQDDFMPTLSLEDEKTFKKKKYKLRKR